jgi:hypothetical protein
LNTVLVLTADETLRGRIARSLSKFSTFEARSESEAYQTLRLVDMDVVLREGKGPAGALAAFVAAAKDIAPWTLVVAIGDLTDDEISAISAFRRSRPAFDAVLRCAGPAATDTGSRRRPRPAPLAPVTNGGEEPAWTVRHHRPRGSQGLAAGLDLPGAGMFLDAIAELVHPTCRRSSCPIRRASSYRCQPGMAPQLVHSIRPRARRAGRLADRAGPAANGTSTRRSCANLLQAGGHCPPSLANQGRPDAGAARVCAAYGRRQMETLFDLSPPGDRP